MILMSLDSHVSHGGISAVNASWNINFAATLAWSESDEIYTGYAGHILRGSSGTLLFNIIDGVIPGRRKRGRPRRLWEEDILEWLRLGTHEELKHLAADRDSYRAAVSSVLATNVHVVANE
ncbi:hypothetical protein M8J77_008798 [Diaphorina citri]|nr:hypothetical protein M8J77_008798 [Diaphorina citri]